MIIIMIIIIITTTTKLIIIQIIIIDNDITKIILLLVILRVSYVSSYKNSVGVSNTLHLFPKDIGPSPSSLFTLRISSTK